MTSLLVALWLANIFFDTLGQIAFKVAAHNERTAEGIDYWLALLRNPWIFVGTGSYVAEFLLWLAFLSLVPLSEGILLGAINIVAIMLAGHYFFKEQLNKLRVIGIAFVALGVAIVGAAG